MAKVLSQPEETGIPEAEWIDDVATYLKDSGLDSANALFKRLDETHKKYKYFEENLSVKQQRLKMQVPDIRANLDVVKNLRRAREAEESLENFFKVKERVS